MGGRAPRGQGFRRAVLKDPGVSAVPEGLGQVGQVALGGSFHCWAGLDGFWGLFLSQELRGVTPRIRSAGGLEGPAPAPCVRGGFGPACSSAPQALCGLMHPRRKEPWAPERAPARPSVQPLLTLSSQSGEQTTRSTRPQSGLGSLRGALGPQQEAALNGEGLRGQHRARGQECLLAGPWAPAGQGGKDKDPQHPDSRAPTSHSLSDELDGVLVLHPTLDEGQRHEDWSPGRTAGPGHPGPGTHPFPDTFTLGAWGGPGFPSFLPAPMEGTGSSCTCCVTSDGQGHLSVPQAPRV